MPWKNGGGKTLEIFCLPTLDRKSFLFRISMADVEMDSPFSNFPNIDRTLFLVSGEGLILKNSKKEIPLIEKWKPIHFSGEDKIDCHLVNGPCKDFNIMVDRNYGRVQSSVLFVTEHTFSCDSDLFFIYDYQSETLTVLEKNDSYRVSSNKEKTLVIIRLTLND